MPYSRFRHERIVEETPGEHNDICLLTDLTGNGRLDILIGGKYGEGNLCWYEAPGWTPHPIGSAYLEAGGVLLDVNGDGRLDLVAGEAIGGGSRRPGGGHELYWFEQPEDPRLPWPRHVIENGLHKYHDQAVGDVDGDGEPEIVIASQQAGIVAYYDIPADLAVPRWPYACRHIVADALSVEGLAVADVYGAGKNAIVAGTNLLLPPARPDGRWEIRPFADYVQPAIRVGDLDGDGLPEVVAAEGESHPARLGWFDPRTGEAHHLADDLFHPHSLALADMTGDGRLDIVVAEMGLGRWENPRVFVYVNLGGGRFERVLVGEGVPTHNAAVGDLDGDGRPDIVGKPYHPGRHVDVWWNTWG